MNVDTGSKLMMGAGALFIVDAAVSVPATLMMGESTALDMLSGVLSMGALVAGAVVLALLWRQIGGSAKAGIFFMLGAWLLSVVVMFVVGISIGFEAASGGGPPPSQQQLEALIKDSPTLKLVGGLYALGALVAGVLVLVNREVKPEPKVADYDDDDDYDDE